MSDVRLSYPLALAAGFSLSTSSVSRLLPHLFGASSSEIAGDSAVVVDEDIGRDQELVEPRPGISRCVKGVPEVNRAVLRDKLLGLVLVAPTGHTDEEHVVTEVVVCLCDRRGFTDAMRSPWSPEPEEDVLAFKIAEVDLSTIKSWDNDIRCRRRRALNVRTPFRARTAR